MNPDIWELFIQIKNSNKVIEKDKPLESDNIIPSEIDLEKKSIDKCSFIKEGKCINCNETDCLQNESEIIVCIKCGVDNGPIIDYDQEWRYYGYDDNKRSSDPNRCGVPNNPLINETSLSTVILGKGYETYRRLNSWNGL